MTKKISIHNAFKDFFISKLSNSRADAIYSIDEKSTIRKSHENPALKKVYEEYLETPGSYRAEKLLHTTHGKNTEN